MDISGSGKTEKPIHTVIRTMSGKESELELFVRSRIGPEIAQDVFIPKKQINKKNDGKWKTVTERMFPGYVFIRTQDPESLFYELKDLKGFPSVRKLMGDMEMRYRTLNPEEEDFIDRLGGKRKDHTFNLSRIVIENGGREYKPGDSVKVIDGDLKDYEAELVRIDLHRRKAIIRTPFMGGAITTVGIELA